MKFVKKLLAFLIIVFGFLCIASLDSTNAVFPLGYAGITATLCITAFIIKILE
jgi:hypothetical protein